LETVTPGVTGEFYYEQTPDALMNILRNFDSSKYDPQQCKNSVKKFSKGAFQQNIKEFVNNVYLMSSDSKAI
jgi:hypothetical protein